MESKCELTQLLDLRKDPSDEIVALAEAARKRHDGIGAVLFYGSCMRSGRFDDGIADLYLLADDYRRAYSSFLPAFLNRLLPPNVFYIEIPYQERILRAKYAVLTFKDFYRGASRWFHSYIWGRFAQPCGIVYRRSERDEDEVRKSLAEALVTFMRRTAPQAPEIFSARDLWETGLGLSYSCEFRPENPAVVIRLFDSAADYYEKITGPALKASGFCCEVSSDEETRYRIRIPAARRRANRLAWSARRAQGKILSALRLLKALLTFENGIEYIFWKIERHSGVRIERNHDGSHPSLASLLTTLWKLLKKGAFR